MPTDDKSAAKTAKTKAKGAAAVLARIGEMPPPFAEIGKRLHDIIMAGAPDLTPRVRYGMPWYMKDGKSWCFFRFAKGFDFLTFGFDDPAVLTGYEGASPDILASAYRITGLDAAAEAKLSAILRHASGA